MTGTGSTRTSSDMDHQPQSHEEEEEEEEEHCAICLSPIENRVSSPACVRGGYSASFGTLTYLSKLPQAVVSPCHHGQFCWGCIRAWTDQSRKVSPKLQVMPLLSARLTRNSRRIESTPDNAAYSARSASDRSST